MRVLAVEMFSIGLAGAGEEAVVPYVGVLVALVGRGGQDLAVAVCHFSSTYIVCFALPPAGWHIGVSIWMT